MNYGYRSITMKTPTLLLTPIALTSVLLGANITQAQTYTPSNRIPVADKTSIGTQVSGSNNNFSITGGLSRGQNLFHSFTDFSVPTGGAATFNHSVGEQSIITRVTGNLFSDINGLVNTQGASFFLINPNGMVFGPNAQLNVGKAFVGSTANGIDLVDGSGRTITFGTNPNGDAPLLSINPNVFFNVSRLNMGGGNGAIRNFGTLQTPNNSYVGLIGGDVTLDGSQGGGKIITPGGRVDIGGLKSDGTITVGNNGMVFGGGGVRSDVSLINAAQIDVKATSALCNVDIFFNNVPSGKSGINISANNMRIVGDPLNSDPNNFTGLFAGLGAGSGVQNLSSGDVNINATGKVILDRALILNPIGKDAESKSVGGININANEVKLRNTSGIVSDTLGKGNAGDINIITTGNTTIFDNSVISSSGYGQGDTGKISIVTPNQLSLNNGSKIRNGIAESGIGNGREMTIQAGELELRNESAILSSTLGQGNAGDIDIHTTRNMSILGSDTSIDRLSFIASDSQGKRGDAGKISIVAEGKLSLNRRGSIGSDIQKDTVGNGRGITIQAHELEIGKNSDISSKTYGNGNAGDISIRTTGNVTMSDNDISSTQAPLISSTSFGQGDAGKITIDTQGKLSLNRSSIQSKINKDATGNSRGITILARELDVNGSEITSETKGMGKAGDILITTIGDINIYGQENADFFDPSSGSIITSTTEGKGNAGKISINSLGKLSIFNLGRIDSLVGSDGVGDSPGIQINVRELEMNKLAFIVSDTYGKGSAGNVDIKTSGGLNINSSQISVSNVKNTISVPTPNGGIATINLNGAGQAGNISISSNQVNLNSGSIVANADSLNGGNIILNISNLLLMRNLSGISTNSGSSQKNGNGGNITINSPLIVATPGDNDITANAYAGNGGKVNITSQGLFGIQYRPKGQDSPFTNDITASSTFGQNGSVNISTPGTDPGKDKGELKAAPNDASKQISQACSASQRDNKFYITGRGGHPPNAEDPLTSEVVWRDPRGAKPQPVANSATQTTRKLAPPAVGWVFDGKGKVTLIAAETEGAPTGTKVVCPKVGK
jgi:filamentous hemagglutinin family protein